MTWLLQLVPPRKLALCNLPILHGSLLCSIIVVVVANVATDIELLLRPPIRPFVAVATRICFSINVVWAIIITLGLAAFAKVAALESDCRIIPTTFVLALVHSACAVFRTRFSTQFSG